MKPTVVVIPKRTTHCPCCGVAFTIDMTVRLRQTGVPKEQHTVEQPPVERAEDDSHG